MIDIARAVGALIPDADTAHYAIAVSGGGDSMALLRLMHEAFPTQITALTVDHCLRAESASEAAQVAVWCAAQNIPHHTLVWEHGEISGNMQAQARIARYNLMRDWCETNATPYLLTAHNRDDVVETLLLRLARGAGVRGLGTMAAVRVLSPRVTLLRPLLQISHEELLTCLRARGQDWIEDPSNQNNQFDRVKMRALLASGLFDATRVMQSAQALASANVALDWTMMRLFGEQAATTAGVTMFRSRAEFAALPAEFTRRLLLHAMEQARGPALPPRQEELERLIGQLSSPDWRGCTLGKCQFAPRGAGFQVKSES